MYCSIPNQTNLDPEIEFTNYPPYPFQRSDCDIEKYLDEISLLEIKKLHILQHLKEQASEDVAIEECTREQSSDPNWFSYRKKRFTTTGRNKTQTNKEISSKFIQSLLQEG